LTVLASGTIWKEQAQAAAWDRFDENCRIILGIVHTERVTIVVQDPSLRTEIITGGEPPEAFDLLKEFLDSGKIKELPGRAAEVRYRVAEGWVRAF
jgi:hypothetical protein